MGQERLTTVVFDLGGVLIDWNPRYLYRKIFKDDEKGMEDFLANVCSPAWRDAQDGNRFFADGCGPLMAQHPDKVSLIQAWSHRYAEMFGDCFQGTVAILKELRDRQTPVYALSNWDEEGFAFLPPRYPFLELFNGIVVSGKEGHLKPHPQIYHILAERYALDPRRSVFVDDRPVNVAGAKNCGYEGILFTSPDALRRDLQSLGFLQ